MSVSLSEILKLSVSERLQLVEDIWDSIAEDQDAFPLTPEQEEELIRLADEARRNPGAGRSWAEIRADLLKES
jgi:putative addiction module component (TIGR02574 family)